MDRGGPIKDPVGGGGRVGVTSNDSGQSLVSIIIGVYVVSPKSTFVY